MPDALSGHYAAALATAFSPPTPGFLRKMPLLNSGAELLLSGSKQLGTRATLARRRQRSQGTLWKSSLTKWGFTGSSATSCCRGIHRRIREFDRHAAGFEDAVDERLVGSRPKSARPRT